MGKSIIPRTCEQCGASFLARKHQIEIGNGRYHNRSCAAKGRGANNPRLTPERFWAKVNKLPSGCWEWTGATNKGGYGILHTLAYDSQKAHRLAWELTHGPIPDGLLICHHCDNPPCCNPDHLFLGTHTDNMKDAFSKGRISRPKGDSHHNAKMSSEEVALARQLHTEGKTTGAALARRFGMSKAAMCKLLRGETYR
jgi:hypothetical protein